MTKTCLAFIADGSEELELIGTVNILRRSGINVTIAGVEGTDCVKCSRDVVICPDASLSDCVGTDFDLVVVPGGGNGVKRMGQSDLVGEVLKKQYNSGRCIAAICAGPTLFEVFSIADNKRVTSYPADKDVLVNSGNFNYSTERVVIDGNIITSQGPGTTIEFGLAIVEKLLGSDVRNRTAKTIIF